MKAGQSVAETTQPESITKRTASSKPHRAQKKATPLAISKNKSVNFFVFWESLIGTKLRLCVKTNYHCIKKTVTPL